MRALKYFVVAAAVTFAASAAQAATVTITNCGAAPVVKAGKKTVINLPADDVVIKCPLTTLPNTDRIEINANSLTLDGSAPDVGSVTSDGKGIGIEINTTAGIIIDNADLIAANKNGKLIVTAGGNISVTTGSHFSAGDQMRITCTGAGCTINFAGTVIDGSQIFITGDGTITFDPTTVITTRCPRDLIVIVSNNGNVLLAGQGLGLGTSCCSQALAACANPNDPDCPFSQPNGQVCLNSVAQLNGFCAIDCDNSPNVLNQCVEGNITILAPLGRIDLTGATLHAGEAITFTALLDVDMTGAQIENCGPKTGIFTVNAATCKVQGATLKDDSPQTAPTLNCTVVGVATELGTCSSQAP